LHEHETKNEFDAGRLDHGGTPDVGGRAGRKDGAIDDRDAVRGISGTCALFDSLRERKDAMKKTNSLMDRITLGLGVSLLVISTGCIVPVGGGGYGGEVVAPGPDLLLFGGGYDRGRDVHVYSQRGFASRAAVHPEAGREAAHSGGGHAEAPHGGGGATAKR
jgi:hypothetical protein